MSLPQRIADKIAFAGPDECWRWTGCHAGRYGQVWVEGRMRAAHRVVYELMVGPIPDGLEIDHVTKNGCRFKDCVNWEHHLEPVTRSENLRRDPGRSYWAERTHCPQGHPYTEENTYRYADGRRACRICRRAWGTRWRRAQGQKERVFRARG